MSGPVGALLESLLEQTTLGEFLTAVENVRKKSEWELDNVTDTSDSVRSSRRGSRKASFLGRIISRKNSGNNAATDDDKIHVSHIQPNQYLSLNNGDIRSNGQTDTVHM